MLYTIDFFHQLMQDECLTFSLSPDVLNVLEHLNKEVEIPDFSTSGGNSGGQYGGGGSGGGGTKTNGKHAYSNEHKNDGWQTHGHRGGGHSSTKYGGDVNLNGKKGNNKKNKKEDNTDFGGNGASGDLNENSAWEYARTFKATVIEKKTGVEKTMDDIRINMNKMSTSTYDKQKTIIAELAKEYFESDYCNDENTAKLGTMILNISSGNKFYSQLYVDLYWHLIELIPRFKDELNTFIDEFDKTIENIVYVDPNVNYDKYCDYVKMNESRQSTTTFLVNLMKKGIVEEMVVLDTIMHFLSVILKYIDEPNKTKEVEEIAENVSILYVNAKSALTKYNDKWTLVENDVQKLAQSYSKEYLSLSNRAIFKFMDMVDM